MGAERSRVIVPAMDNVLIFGATSAIASEVAVIHAARGHRLHLVGRAGLDLTAPAQL